MIDHERRVIFIHIPKTGGVSVYAGLGIQDQQGHMTIDDYADYRREYFSFTFVRNPWDRALSCFLYVKNGGRGIPADLEAQASLADCDSFDDFARNIGEYRRRLGQIRIVGPTRTFGYPHLLPQTFWTHDERGGNQFDFIGRFERIDEDFAVVGQRLGESLHLPHRNATRHGDYTEYYTSRSRDAIAREYQSDIELLRYEF